ncbi:unnamed protein product [Auanema sp. JU1783]|nr:unnamed protein product [Auanema sp. JU1783]
MTSQCTKSFSTLGTNDSGLPNEEIAYLSQGEFWSEITDDYVQKLADTDPLDVFPSNNPGPTKDDGSMNFECHCVGHMVASPCGWEFREAITCQKVATDEEMQNGRCGDEMMSFMECVMRTQCFKGTGSESTEEEK